MSLSLRITHLGLLILATLGEPYTIVINAGLTCSPQRFSALPLPFLLTALYCIGSWTGSNNFIVEKGC